jgi:hypothetical protein
MLTVTLGCAGMPTKPLSPLLKRVLLRHRHRQGRLDLLGLVVSNFLVKHPQRVCSDPYPCDRPNEQIRMSSCAAAAGTTKSVGIPLIALKAADGEL